MKRSFLYLAGLTIVSLLLLWIFSSGNGTSKNSIISNSLMPEISKQINDVDRVEIISAGNHTVATMVRIGGHWQLEQMGGYQADWSRLQTLLASLAQATIVEPKTDKAEYYARLGVEDITGEDAGGVLVRLGIGDQTRAVLVGHEAQGRPGQYVRLQNSPASALVDRKLDVSTELMDWADSRIVDIGASEVAEVEIIHPGGERLLITRVSADQTDFDVVGLPGDREITNSWAVNSMGSALSMLDMETVRPVQSADWSDAVKMRLLTFSGMEIIAGLMVDEDQFLMRLDATHPASVIIKNRAGESVPADELTDIEKQAMQDVSKAVDEINRKVAGWAYGISEQEYNVMINKLENLLKPLESQ